MHIPHCWKSVAAHLLAGSGDFYCLLITYANSLDLECRSSSGTKLFDNLILFLKDLFLKSLFHKSQMMKITQHVKSEGVSWVLNSSGPEVIKLEYSLKFKIKRNDRLLADTCLQAANHYALFSV